MVSRELVNMYSAKDIAQINQTSERISSTWKKEQLFYRPVVVVVGGFQASGKTQLLNALVVDPGLPSIRSDEIREGLDMPFERREHLIDGIMTSLIIRATDQNMSFSIDRNSFSERIKQLQILLRNKIHYQLIPIFLYASRETLEKRLVSRRKTSGRYLGTLSELRRSMENTIVDLYDYGLTINTETMDPIAQAQLARQLISCHATRT